MRKLIRVLLILSGVLLALVIGVYLWLLLRQSDSGKQLVHQQSETIIRINVDQIATGMFRNAVSNPGEYLKTDRDTVDKVRFWKVGVTIPANLYFFSIPEDSLSFYTVLNLKDEAKFQQYLTQQMGMEISHVEDFLWSARTDNGRFEVIGDNHRVILSYSLRKREENGQIYELWLASEELVAINTLDIPDVSQSTSPITYWNRGRQNIGCMDFSSGRIDLKGSFSSPLWRISEKSGLHTITSDYVLSIHLDADIREALIHYRDFLMRYQVDIDQIQPYIGNYWAVQLREGDVLQQDTIITYDYDDNFELVEKKDVQNDSVPNLSFAIKASPHLLSYLPDKAFYRFYKRIDNGIVRLSTDSAVSVSTASSVGDEDNYSFYLSYRRGDAPHILQRYFPQISILNRVEIKGTRQDAHRLDYEGYVLFENTNLHPVRQLLN